MATDIPRVDRFIEVLDQPRHERALVDGHPAEVMPRFAHASHRSGRAARPLSDRLL